MDMEVRRSATDEDLAHALDVRRTVFTEEQGVAPELDQDGADSMATHVVACADGTVIATGRLIRNDGQGRIGRMAVLREWRRMGVGSRVLDALEAEARRQGMSSLMLHAQVHAQTLYQRAGYEVQGELFTEAGIDHVTMSKRL